MRAIAAIIALLLLNASLSRQAGAATDLVTNGNFATTSYTANNQFGSAWSQTVMQGVTGWIGDAGYNIFYFNGTATTVSAVNQYSSNSEKLYAANGFTGSSPKGDNFVAFDADPTVGGGGGISQTINGLTKGTNYSVSFTWAGSQLQSETGATTEMLKVSLGGQTISTNTVSNASKGFTGWVTQAYTFSATATSEVLSFLAVGTPTGFPPVVVLTDISMVNVPEPGTMAVLVVGLTGIAAARRRRGAR